jgi:plasmid stabilization system protein ParE
MNIRILPAAQSDIVEGFSFYEENQTGLGAYFIESILSDIDGLAATAGIHPIQFGKFKKIATRFPYSIFYLIENDLVDIYAVVDNRRNPEWISDRLN